MRRAFIAFGLSAVLLTAGCESSEEKAERYYQSGLELLEAGDVERALVEFRNVFQYDGFHREARQTYAALQLERGEVAEAYRQYLRLIEQYPDDVPARLTLAEIASQRGDWDEVTRHGEAAIALAPDDARARAIGLALEYRDAVAEKDTAARKSVAERASALLEEATENQVARRIVIDQLLSGPEPELALPEVDRAIEVEPDSLEFHAMKFRLLNAAGRTADAGAQLETMFEQFPENEDVRSSLVSWYLSREDYDRAEAVLRKLAGAEDAATDGHLALVQFLRTARDDAAAEAELDRLIAANAGRPAAGVYRAFEASIAFDNGRRDEAIASLQAILDAEGDPSEERRGVKVLLARMLSATGNNVGARSLVEEVLADDRSNVDALKMRASWLVEEDRPDAAITDLRAALDQAPRDSETLTLMAMAHERAGSPELAGERLALAVEVSGQAVPEAIRYSRFLAGQGRVPAAIAVLTEARRANPESEEILGALADLRLQQGNWSELEGILADLGALGTPQAQEAARSLRASILMGQDRLQDGLDYLSEQVEQGDDTAKLMVAMAQIRGGKFDEARRYLDTTIAESPDDMRLRVLSASLYAVVGDLAAAEATFRRVIDDVPEAEQPVQMLHSLLISQDRRDEARQLLDAALERQPDSRSLRIAKAGMLEQDGEYDGAIDIYEALYAEDSSDIVIANNLASMIATHRDDADQLERAYAIARRLRGLDVPAFQDTYGWIEFRRGNASEALEELRPAAEGLPDDPFVQMHLGLAYAALDRPEEAIGQLNRALDLAGEAADGPQFEAARSALAGLQSAQESDETN